MNTGSGHRVDVALALGAVLAAACELLATAEDITTRRARLTSSRKRSCATGCLWGRREGRGARTRCPSGHTARRCCCPRRLYSRLFNASARTRLEHKRHDGGRRGAHLSSVHSCGTRFLWPLLLLSATRVGGAPRTGGGEGGRGVGRRGTRWAGYILARAGPTERAQLQRDLHPGGAGRKGQHRGTASAADAGVCAWADPCCVRALGGTCRKQVIMAGLSAP